MEINGSSVKRLSSVSLVVALGNPGDKYQFSRHNIAWQLLEHLPFFPDLIWKRKFKGEYTSTTILDDKVWLLAPLTFMNLSGQSLVAMMNYHKISIDQVLIIHDELELEFGIAGFKDGGGLAGHNGLRSVAQHLGTRNFKRFRLGISRPSHRDITSYVLGDFSSAEQSMLPGYLGQAAQLLQTGLKEDFGFMVKKFRKVNLI